MGNYSMPGYFQQMPVIQGKKYHPAADNEAELKGIEAELHKKIEEMLAAGTPDDKIHAKGQYTAMERINELVDEGSFLPLNSLYNPADNDEQKIGIIGTSIVKGLGRIDGKWAVIVASDNKKMAGAWVAGQADDLLRGSDTAKMLHIPLVYILNCSGVKLDEQEKVYPNRRGGGTPFYRNAQLNQLGVPVIVGIYGTNPAGGGYHSISPTILIAHQKANMAVGGAGIVGGMDSKPYVDAEGAQGMIDATRKMKNDPPGSVSIHYNETGFFREVYAEEFGVLDGIRKYMGMLPAYDLDFFRVDTPKAPAIQGEELYHIVPRNTRRPYDMYNVLAALGKLLHHEQLLLQHLLCLVRHRRLSGAAQGRGRRHAEAREAKKRGEPVGWSSSKFPCELAEAFDLHVMYPENQAAGIAANRYGELLCQAAEDLGYDNDICGYARISLAYAAGKRASRKFDPETGEYIIDPATGRPLKDADGNVVIDEATGKPKKDPKTQTPYIVLDDLNEINALPDGPEKECRLAAIAPIKQMQIPMPDFVLCCNNICNCMTKWYENIARMHNIPLVMIDIPYNNTVTVDDTYVAYIRGQFDAAIKQLEQISGRKFDEEKFKKACANANRTAKAWLKVCDYLQYKPAPYSGFDLFNHMADVVTARGKVAAAETFEQLAVDLEKAIQEGTTTTPFPEKYRVMFEGIPCWPKLPALFKPLKANGVNVTAVVYAPAFGFVYDDLDGMVRAYCKAPNSVCIEQGVDWREGICRDNKVDGVLVHYNRSCKPWSGYMAEMQRRFTKDLGIPCAGFDGDQADPRNFNAAQYETRVQGLVEAMEANKQAKEADPQ